MKKIISSCLLLFVCLSFTQDPVLLVWHENQKLTWDDFKGDPDKQSPFKALTESEIKTDLTANGKEAHITISVYFDRSKSWVKEIRNDVLLAHEQVHFDITELWARKFRQKLKGKTFAMKAFQNEIRALQNSIFMESKNMQQEYDKETKHSEIAESQKHWEKKIKEDLEKLAAYSAHEVTCTIRK